MRTRYECDGQTQLVAFNESVPIPFPKGVMNGSTQAGAGRGCADEGECVPPPNITRSLRKGYYASVSYTDHLVGMLLDKLVELKHEDDTVVGLIGGEECNLVISLRFVQFCVHHDGSTTTVKFHRPRVATRRAQYLGQAYELWCALHCFDVLERYTART